MTEKSKTEIDFIAQGENCSEWLLVLVEEGPWRSKPETELRRIQSRLYDCIDAALDGQVAHAFPQTKGKTIVVRLDCYNVPKDNVDSFFKAFSAQVLKTPDYNMALINNDFVRAIEFDITFDNIH